MNTTLKVVAAAIAASLLGAPSLANATDIRLSNLSNTAVHPWFRSNCFALPTASNVWVNFGNVDRFSQFTWPQFELLLDPTCKKPVVEFTYNVGTMLPPLENLPAALTSRIKFRSDMGLIGFHVVTSTVHGPDDNNNDHNDD